MEVKCPRCGIKTIYDTSNPSRPFCSERCQTQDLGAWAEEKYRVPDAEIPSEDVNANEDLGPEVGPPKHRLN